MRVFAKLLFSGVLTLATGPQMSMASQDMSSIKTRYADALSLLETNQDLAFAEMAHLAEQGYARAYDRLGYFTLKGLGTPVDPNQAALHYETAVKLGHDRSLLALAKTQARLGQYDQAISSFETALALNLRGARVEFLTQHAINNLGPSSKPEQATDSLISLAKEGDRAALLGVLYAATKTGSRLDSEDELLHLAISFTDAGDAKVAEKLLPYLRIFGDKDDQTRSTRQALLGLDGVRGKTWSEETLYLLAERSPESFSTDAASVLSEIEQPNYARALFVASRISKNAFVLETQQELAGLGYHPGPASGFLTGKTIRAVAAFCKDVGIIDVCRHGPLKSDAIKLISRELAVLKFQN